MLMFVPSHAHPYAKARQTGPTGNGTHLPLAKHPSDVGKAQTSCEPQFESLVQGEPPPPAPLDPPVPELAEPEAPPDDADPVPALVPELAPLAGVPEPAPEKAELPEAEPETEPALWPEPAAPEPAPLALDPVPPTPPDPPLEEPLAAEPLDAAPELPLAS
jgi:hypothetical protein